MPATAARRRRFVPDLRLVIGVVLVVGSVAAVTGIVSAADARAVVLAAAGPLSPGDRIRVGDLVERDVALDGAGDLYLTVATVPADGLVVVQSVRAGELVPVSAVGSAAGLLATAIVLESASPVSAAVAPGAPVDVWASAAMEQLTGPARFGPPVVLVPDAIVVRVLDDDDGLVAGSGAVGVEVLVPRARVARLLQSIANEDALAIVPAGLPLGQ